ncbi:MAG: neutral/alkaline non-lysosomal ceramidase N-terminal domain-containing protein [Promethearchaeota archaeon]
MKAGYCQVIITPPLGQIAFAGYNGRRYFPRDVLIDDDGIRHELKAHALVLAPDNASSNKEKMCIVTTDLFMIRYYWVKEVRALASKLTGIPPANICIHATHGHNAPDTIGIYYPGHDFDARFLDKEWLEFLKRQIAGAIYCASKHMVGAKIGFSEGKLEGFTINRRDMGLYMNPPENPRTIDPSIPIIKIEQESINHSILITGFSTHPTFMLTFEAWCNEHVTFLEKEVHKRFGSSVDLMYFTCQAGDIIPFQPINDDKIQFVLNPVGTELSSHQRGIHIRPGCKGSSALEVENLKDIISSVNLTISLDELAAALEEELDVMASVDGNILRVDGQVKDREIFNTLVKYIRFKRSLNRTRMFAKKFIDEVSKHYDSITMTSVNDLVMAHQSFFIEMDDEDMVESFSPLMEQARIQQLDNGLLMKETEVQGIKIGNNYIVCLPSEPINEIGLRLKKLIKEQADLDHVFVFQMCNDGFGYVVTPFEHEAGGYEVSVFCFGKNNGKKMELEAISLASTILKKSLKWKNVRLPTFKQAPWPRNYQAQKDLWIEKQHE